MITNCGKEKEREENLQYIVGTTRRRTNNIRRDSGYYSLMAGSSKELTGRGLGRGNIVVWKQQKEQEGQPIQSPKSVVPSVGCKT